MHKVEYGKAQKLHSLGWSTAAAKTATNTCNSAPGKKMNNPEISNLDRPNFSAAAFTYLAKDKEITSRFSSCTGNTCPSTDNNSCGYGQTQMSWDAAI